MLKTKTNMNKYVRVSPVAYPAPADSSLHEEIVELTQTHSSREFVSLARGQHESVWTNTMADAIEAALVKGGNR